MQTVVFCEFKNGKRDYLQTEESHGYAHDFYYHKQHNDNRYGLDSRVSIFPDVKSAQDVIQGYLGQFVSVRDKHDAVIRVGYHGITENGNACPPFHIEDNNVRRMHRHPPQYTSCLPDTVSAISPVTVSRLGNLSVELVRKELTYLTDNMVEEELLKVESFFRQYSKHWIYQFTDIDKYTDQAIVHFNKGLGGHTKSFSVVITAFNLLAPL